MMPEKNPEAALLGLPGRTTMLGRRMPTASSRPFRVWSASSSSQIAFCVPYEVSGVRWKSSGIASGNGAPNTAIDDVKTNLGT